jgi:hypothetical protein
MTFDIQWGGLHTVISGGQTGADQGGLEAARKAGIRTGGQAAALYKTSIGLNPLLQAYDLTAKGSYDERTLVNIKAADATVIIAHNLQSPGTVLTRRYAKIEGTKLLELDVSEIVRLAQLGPMNGTEAVIDLIVQNSGALAEFIKNNQVQVLNVAGNRELKSDGRQYGHLVMHMTTEWIVGTALELLDLDAKLVKLHQPFLKV